MACWIPVIAYKNWGSEYIIKDEKVWKVLEKNDEKHLLKWIIEMLNKKFNNIYINQYVTQKYSWEIIKRHLKNLYFN